MVIAKLRLNRMQPMSFSQNVPLRDDDECNILIVIIYIIICMQEYHMVHA